VFDDPAAYAAGVEDAFAVMRELSERADDVPATTARTDALRGVVG
jgi:hypothetical protein